MAVPNFEETLDILCYNEPRRKKRNITATVPGTVRRIRPSRSCSLPRRLSLSRWWLGALLSSEAICWISRDRPSSIIIPRGFCEWLPEVFVLRRGVTPCVAERVTEFL